MLKIITCNTNGIRSAQRKGFFDWLSRQRADLVCLQETRAQEQQLTHQDFYPQQYHCYYHDAQRKGYSGTALFSRVRPRRILRKLGWEPSDSEGRYLQADFERLSVISLYLPSGSSGEEALRRKYRFMDRLYGQLRELRKRKRECVICADWNICHQPIDLKNWRSNQRNSGFLPEERAWLNRVFDELGYVDSFRLVNQQPEQYTWWSNRGQSWAKNVGWRLDYQLITPALVERTLAADIYREQRFSDHAPHTMEFDWDLKP